MNGGEEQREITRRCGAEAELVAEDMAVDGVRGAGQTREEARWAMR